MQGCAKESTDLDGAAFTKVIAIARKAARVNCNRITECFSTVANGTRLIDVKPILRRVRVQKAGPVFRVEAN